jgi:HlyD family secretion protein
MSPVPQRRRLRWLLGSAIVLVAGALAWRQWQGPAVPVYRLEQRPLVHAVVATGRVVAPTRVEVGSEITAVVRERLVQEGDKVAVGTLLAVLQADDLAARVREAEAGLEQLERAARPQAETALREAEAQLAQAERELTRRRELFERQLIARASVEQAAQAEIVARAAAETARVRRARLALGEADEAVLRERLAAAQAAFAKTEIRAAVAGTVLSRNAERGDIVQPGSVLFEMAADGPVEVLVPVDEKSFGTLALGQRARCVTDAYPDDVFEARVTLITPKVDPLRGTVDVRLSVDSAPSFLREDMTVSVNIETARRERALAVPNDAIRVASDGGSAVLVLRGGRTALVHVALGLRGLTMSEITEGALAAGDLVLASGAVSAGERVRAVLEPLPAAAPQMSPSGSASASN